MKPYAISDLGSKPKLLPCPFCGAKAAARVDTVGSVVVACTECRIATPWAANALELWNNRAPDS